MNTEIQDLIDAYFDDSLSPEQLGQLSQWIQSDRLHAEQFASNLMLHDRLRNESTAKEELLPQSNLAKNSAAPDCKTPGSETPGSEAPGSEAPGSAASDNNAPNSNAPDSHTRRRRLVQRPLQSTMALVSTVCVVLAIAVFFQNGFGTSSVSAAVGELNRIIAANRESADRTFVISVEQSVAARRVRNHMSPEHLRPPKPSLDEAILAVRGSNQFVLKRKVNQSDWFITGSNGTTSWAVRPEGPVRCSNDLTRFHRDLPGHEWSLPINNLHDGLDALRSAYDLKVSSLEDSEKDGGKGSDTESGTRIPSKQRGCRRMMAARKPRCLGASNIQITYSESSGQIQAMRFINMPYGRNLVTLRMTLIDEQSLAADYFDHQSHHDADRIVEFE
ncbi:MAG: hypothetical protein ABJZ55_10310 [Fuerstiella sp.]